MNPENSNMQPLAKWLLINYQKAVTRDRKRDTPGGEDSKTDLTFREILQYLRGPLRLMGDPRCCTCDVFWVT